jgi:uncharacterized membrane protein
MRRAGVFVAMLAAACALVSSDLELAAVRPVIGIGVLLVVPTTLVYRRFDLLGDSAAARVLYAFGSVVLGVLLLGVVLNTLLPLAGVERPLQPKALGIAVFVANIALLSRRSRQGASLGVSPRTWLRRAWVARLEPAQTLGALSLVLAVLGAVRLNNGAGAGIALASLFLAAAALVAMLLRAPRSASADLRCLVLVALGLLLATSLRGWTITGHDIQSEYLAFRLTNEAQRWRMETWQNAYNACLSLNVLPTVIAQATGLSGVIIFKVLVQVVFALVPALNFLLASRFLGRRPALAAAIFTMALPTFYTDMPYLVRQEIAFFFLALMLLAATAPAARRQRRRVVGFLGLGVVLAHYSTTYVMLLGLVLGLTGLVVWRALGRVVRPRTGATAPHRPRLVLLSPPLVVFLAVASWAWAGPVTHTGGHAADVAREALAAVLGSGDGGPGSSDLSYLLWFKDDTTPRERLDLFINETMTARRQVEPDVLLFRNPGEAVLRPPLAEPSRLEPTVLGSAADRVGLAPEAVIRAVRIAGAGALQVLLLCGIFRIVRDRRIASVRRIPEEARFVAIGSLAALAVVIVVPELSVDYGVLRAMEQALLVVSGVAAVGLGVIGALVRARAAVTVAVPIVLFVFFSGLFASALGGYPARLALGNSGLYYDRYYASDSDVEAVAWLTAPRSGPGAGARVVANRNVGVRLLAAQPTTRVDDRLYPTLLARGDYVFVDSRLEETGRAAVFYTGDLITYRYPLRQLQRRLDLVYSAQHTRIYR